MLSVLPILGEMGSFAIVQQNTHLTRINAKIGVEIMSQGESALVFRGTESPDSLVSLFHEMCRFIFQFQLNKMRCLGMSELVLNACKALFCDISKVRNIAEM